MTRNLIPLIFCIFFVSCSKNPTTRVNEDFKTFTSALDNYFSLAQYYPTTNQGLKALAEMPLEPPTPRRWVMLLQDIPKDPWGNDYVYISNWESFTLKSLGHDGRESEDDITFKHKSLKPSKPPKMNSLEEDAEIRKPRIRKLN